MSRILAALFLLCAAALSAQEVALTFDDLPRHGALPPGATRVQIAHDFVAALKAANAPETYGFMNAQKIEEDESGAEVLRIWRDGGLLLASHAYSHMDLHANTIEAFKQDIERNEAAGAALMQGQDWHWFRYPQLREGNTLEKRHAIRAHLQERGYRTAQVTVDFEDYLWNGPYAHCMPQGDAEAVAELKASYLDFATQYIELGQQLSRILFDRDMKHVMLLHTGAFNALMLPDLLQLFDRLNFKLIPLGEAHSDPAYLSDPDIATERGETLLQQLMAAKSLQFPPHQEVPIDRLRHMCRLVARAP